MMMKKNGDAGTEDTKKKVKKRIFYPNHIYVADKNNIVFANGTSKEELEGYKYDDDDTVLIAIHPKQFFKHVSKVESIVIDFTKSMLSIKGSKVTLAKVEYEEGDIKLEPEDMKDWSSILEDAYKACKNVTVLGVPPIEGECLDEY